MASTDGPSVKLQAGQGEMVLEQVAGKARFTTCSFKYPLKLMLPETSRAHLGPAFMLSFGGGLVHGDRVAITACVKHRCTLLLLTQGSTKVFKPLSLDADPVANAQKQTLDVQVASNAEVILLPAPVTCFARASYSQKQAFELVDETCSIVILDWLTSGRKAMGEHWQFIRYRSELRVNVAGKPLLNDILLLEHDYQERVEPYSCYATLFLSGPVSVEAREYFEEAFHAIQQPFRRTKQAPDPLLWAYSPVSTQSGIVRLAGLTTEVVRDFLRQGLASLEPVIGSELYKAAWA